MLILTSLALDSLISLKSKALPTVDRKLFNLSCFALSNAVINNLVFPYRSATSKLTMENVPWHSDVKAFSEAMALKSKGEYEVACEHVHSCCVLLAKTEKFKVDGQWFTWIDYDEFHDLVVNSTNIILSEVLLNN